MRRLRLMLLALTASLWIAPYAGAFKIDTHVWIAQQVINDVVDDGRVEIPHFNSFVVRPDIVAALRQYQDEYRMGAIGPDGFPDLIGGQVSVHPGVPNGWKTDRWLAEVLDKAQSPRQKAFAYGYLSHAAADTFAHSYVNMYAGDMFDLFDGREAELRHMAVEEFIKKHMPPIRDNTGRVLNPYEVIEAPASFLRDTLVLNASVANQYRKQANTRYLALMYDYWLAIGNVLDGAEKIKNEANAQINILQSEIDSIRDELDNATDIEVTVWGKTVDLYPAYCFVDPATCAAIETTKLNLNATKTSLEVPKKIHDLTVSSLKTPLQAWRSEVEEAIRQYMITSREVARELMKPPYPDPPTDVQKNCANEDYANPKCRIEEWLCEWGPVFAGVPNEANMPACATRSAINRVKKLRDDITSGIDQFRQAVVDEAGIAGWAIDPLQKSKDIRDEIETDIRNQFNDLAKQIAAELTGSDSLAVDLIEFRTEQQTDEKMDQIFAADSTGKGILPFPPTSDPVSHRIKADMHLDPVTGEWDPEAYNVVYNAVILSKLALLDASQLNLLVKRAGVDDTIYGTDLYDPTEFKNILIGSIRSIDGNHQWQEFPPPYPRVADAADDGIPDDGFGYAFGSPQRGFRLWQDCEVRDLVFETIFKGPLAPALTRPDTLGLGSVPAYATAAITDTHPFPLASRSDLKLKALTEDPDLELSSFLSLGDMTRILGQTHVKSTTKLESYSLTDSTYSYDSTSTVEPEDMIVELSAQACGGNIENMDTQWSFKAESNPCLYTCEVTSETITLARGTVTLVEGNCSSDRCGTLPTISTIEEAYDYGLAPAPEESDCAGMCHGPNTAEGLLSPGTFLMESTYVAGLPAHDNGVEFDGSLICDKDAIATKLVMKAVDNKNILTTITNPETNERSVAEDVKSRDYGKAALATYPSWETVSQAILTDTKGKKDACGVVQVADEKSFEADTTPPVIEAPADITLSCSELQNRLAAGTTTAQILGTPHTSDDRDGDLSITNDAPAALLAGETMINWVAEDDAGNSAFDTQTVTVTDNEAPQIQDVTGSITLTATSPTGVAYHPQPRPSAVDSCDGEVEVSTSRSLARLPIGTTQVVWRASDSSGNSAETSQTITVEVLKGDLDVDGAVTEADLVALVSRVGETVDGEKQLRDFDGNGTIDEIDKAVYERIQAGEHDPKDLNKDYAIDEKDARQLFGLLGDTTGVDNDADGVVDTTDNCLSAANPEQNDPDGDGFGSACDPDGEELASDPASNGGGGGGGGCAISSRSRFDPVLPALVLSAFVYLGIRRKQRS